MFTCIGILTLHFFLLASYSLRKYCPERLAQLATNYTYPFFHQEWNLFVPPPHNTYRLWVEDKSGKWTEIFSPVTQQHRANLFAGKGHLLLSFVNTIHYFEENTNQRAKLNGPIKGDGNFEILKFSAGNYLNSNPECKLILMVTDIRNSNSRVYFN